MTGTVWVEVVLQGWIPANAGMPGKRAGMARPTLAATRQEKSINHGLRGVKFRNLFIHPYQYNNSANQESQQPQHKSQQQNQQQITYYTTGRERFFSASFRPDLDSSH